MLYFMILHFIIEVKKYETFLYFYLKQYVFNLYIKSKSESERERERECARARV